MALRVRQGDSADVADAAAILVASRRAFEDCIPPLIHRPEDVVRWLNLCVQSDLELWVAEDGGRIVAMMLLGGRTIEQLYVDPRRTGEGIGSSLVEHAQSERRVLELWTFQSNVRAQRFYLRHGFVEVQRTDGDNEEEQPDIKMQWICSSAH